MPQPDIIRLFLPRALCVCLGSRPEIEALHAGDDIVWLLETSTLKNLVEFRRIIPLEILNASVFHDG